MILPPIRIWPKKHIHAKKLENSYAGILGKKIEPVIEPLGYDWKIGIALITSFAAREVFVGTMATLYSVGDDENSDPLKEKMRSAVKSNGDPCIYTGHRRITNDILSLCHAMHEHTCHCKKRNPQLEMAIDTIGIYDGTGLRDEPDCLPALKIVILLQVIEYNLTKVLIPVFIPSSIQRNQQYDVVVLFRIISFRHSAKVKKERRGFGSVIRKIFSAGYPFSFFYICSSCC